jgi:hypothetical protein
MDIYFSPGAVVTAVVFLLLGLVAYALLLKPFVSMGVKAFRREIVEEQNVALAILAGFLSLALSIIVASVIH